MGQPVPFVCAACSRVAVLRICRLTISSIVFELSTAATVVSAAVVGEADMARDAGAGAVLLVVWFARVGFARPAAAR